MKFPRAVWAGSHIKNAPQMKRKIVLTKNDYINFVKIQNNRTNVYTTVYDFEHFSETAQIDSSVILDRIFLDFDGHDGDLKNAYRDIKVLMDWVIEQNISHTLFFSGRGFHLFLDGERTDNIRNIQAYFKEIKNMLIEKVGIENTLDDRVGQKTRLRRVPNTVNMSSSDKNGNALFCIPLFYDDLSLSLDELIVLASKPRSIPFRKVGNIKVKFPEQPPIDEVEGEVSVPKYDGKLPLLPCLHNAIMTENPSHMARAYLVSWYRDLLTLGTNLNSLEEKNKVLDMIVSEIKTSFGERDDVWLDWDESETRKHARFTVNGNYKTPFCNKLISEGYCVGKCWRFPDVNN